MRSFEILKSYRGFTGSAAAFIFLSCISMSLDRENSKIVDGI
ncbi:putative lipoprotein [Leptospira inadai serovar Lyme str. 10]|uniref:Putative lipoprotein n=1 Tax=Leptospira inadai serovar Lyme str. 10 TaxID=1049790 RepID=V6HDH3_9LEPT|nr:putative lipoprotein [Leptospira inadai serovar Lyme str. 10]